mgnify:CR=1 FL=1
MATIYEVSRLAGVSLATVSRVVNNSDRVSARTREKVQAAMKELDYRPNSIAQSLATNRTNCVGVLVSELHGPVFGAMVSSIEKVLREAGKIAIFATGHNDRAKEEKGVEFLIDRSCDALILHIEALSDEFLQKCQASGAPLVFINRSIEGMEDHCIVLDNEHGGYLATKALLDLGHRQIAYIAGPLELGDARARLEGHKRALAEYGLAPDPALETVGDYHEAGGSRAMGELLDSGQAFTGVVCANDEMAAGAMSVIRSRGFSIPEDLSIVGFDNARWARYLYPRLTTVDYPVDQMGQMAGRWVLQNVYGLEGDPVQRAFRPELVVRESARAIGGDA